MPRSVTMPVMCVVRISALEILVTIAFCSPMMKLSTSTVVGRKMSTSTLRLAPSRPNSSSNTASSISEKAYSLCRCRRRAQFTSTAVVAAPATKAQRAASPAAPRKKFPSTRLSAISETMPVM
ncbi:hypothetical protein D9M68_858920 [compost metagenome]